MSWLADASANKIVKSYIQDFVDISGNFKVRHAVSGTVVDNGPVAWNQLGADINGEAADDRSGWRLSLSSDGTIVAIGATNNDGNGAESGHVRIYGYSGSSWTQLGSDINGEAAGDQLGFDVSLSSDGTILATGAWTNDGNGANSGHVRIYEYNGSSWTQLGADIDGEGAGDVFGGSVTLSSDGTIVAIGGTRNDGGGTDSGHVRIYGYNGSSWSQLGADIDGSGAGESFGKAISLSSDGTIAAIGAQGVDGLKSGLVRVYEYNGSSWSQLGVDIDSEGEADRFGGPLSLSSDGTILAAGGSTNDGNGADSGHVRIYKYSGGSWTQLGSDIDGEAAGDYSGLSISLSSDGTIVAIGANLNDGGGTDSGHVRVYNKTGGTVTTPGSEIIPMDVSGGIVSFNTNTMKIEDGTVDISGTTWINQGQSGASIASSNQGAFIVESAGTSSSNAVVYVETAGQTQAFSIRENGDLYSANALQHSSDDRRKTNEQYITNATETIQKLSPQIYTKLNDLVQNGGTPTKTESGLIAQEIYYNAPELRHLVHIEDSAGNKLTPQEYDLSGNDIQNDPDYTALGWGNKSATVDYTGLIPYLIKANQEKQTILEQQDATIDEQKTMVDDLLARISALE